MATPVPGYTYTPGGSHSVYEKHKARTSTLYKAFVGVLENIPITNYLQAAIGYDLYGNKLTFDDRMYKLNTGLGQSVEALIGCTMMNGIVDVSGPVFSLNQQALLDLAKDARKMGRISASEANILVEWANEYGITNHGIMTHNRGGHFNGIPHAKIKNHHIKIK